jgi:NADH:ubiquinone oxidoreductase subunit F (NADH-binding)
VRGRPTLVDNVETLAHLALIARHGDAWFGAVGTDRSPGTTLITVGGAVDDPGVYEIDHGTTLGAALHMAGGPLVPVQAMLVGGLGGTWVGSDAAEVPFSHEGGRSAGTALGIASMIVLPADVCGIAESARVLRFLADESAGQCGPCMFGLPAIADDMDELAASPDRADRALTRLRSRLQVIPGRGACAHPDGAARMAASALRVFADDVAHHAAGSPCPWTGQPSWVPVPAGQLR